MKERIEKLVEKTVAGQMFVYPVKTEYDKTMRFTDWFRRPLSEKQVKYALCDVTYLRDVYAKLVTSQFRNASIANLNAWLISRSGAVGSSPGS